jgi:acetyl-CoA acetyltransferase
MAIATAAKQIIVDKMDVVAAGGQDSISMVQTPEMRIAPDRGSGSGNDDGVASH